MGTTLRLPPSILEFVPSLGGICSQFADIFSHRYDTLHGFSGLSASSFPRTGEVAVPSVHRNIILSPESLESGQGRAKTKQAADRHRSPAPTYQLGQNVWLSTKDIPQLAPRFIDPLKIERIIWSSAVRLKLPPFLKIHHSFHVSLLL